MVHYRQTGKAIDKFYEQAAGTGENAATQKTVGKTVGEHAGKGCSGVDAGKTGIATSPCISTACNECACGANGVENPKVAGAGLEPAALRL